MNELPVDTLPGIAKMNELPVDTTPGIAKMNELPVFVSTPRALPGTPPRAYPTADTPDPPSGNLRIVIVRIAKQFINPFFPGIH
ncbi:MAG: hypothetical protein BWY95_00682 [Bacteroidetes bacterium ADurb.BinA104]|nr:MAG: hypothetical protein BWY95_00682 [Bacteroidetes bacterium ADurb.BinA104]